MVGIIRFDLPIRPCAQGLSRKALLSRGLTCVWMGHESPRLRATSLATSWHPAACRWNHQYAMIVLLHDSESPAISTMLFTSPFASESIWRC